MLAYCCYLKPDAKRTPLTGKRVQERGGVFSRILRFAAHLLHSNTEIKVVGARRYVASAAVYREIESGVTHTCAPVLVFDQARPSLRFLPARQVDMYCEILNEQISAERYRTAGAGCGRGDNTPYIRDTALLSFRHSFALNVQVKYLALP